jgi:hypothetical protein
MSKDRVLSRRVPVKAQDAVTRSRAAISPARKSCSIRSSLSSRQAERNPARSLFDGLPHPTPSPLPPKATPNHATHRFYQHRTITGLEMLLGSGMEPTELPANAVVFAVVRRPAPEGAVLPVKEDRIDRARGVLLDAQRVTHLGQLIPDFLTDLVVQVELAR